MSKTTHGYSSSFMIKFLFTNLIRYGLRLWNVIVAIVLGLACAVAADKMDSKLHKCLFRLLAAGISIILALHVLYTYLTKCDYITQEYPSYSSVYATMFLLGVLTVFIAVVRVFSKGASMAEKLLGVIVVSI